MNILVAEDDLVSGRIIEALLVKWGYEVAISRDGEDAWARLQGPDRPRLAVLDWMMPGLDGVEVCRRVRQAGGEPYVYILLLTAKGQKEDIVQGLEAGADDYVVKPFDPHELQVRLRTGRRIVDLQEQLIAARERLRQQAEHDPLTGLRNRTTLQALLRREADRALRENAPLTVLMADLDHFKKVNDTLGHMAGDAVLRELAGRLVRAVRSYDTVLRYGGEEFLLVLPGCGRDRAEGLAERVRACADSQPMNTSEGLVSITLSVGAAVASGGEKIDVEKLVAAADGALYRAKANGRNRVEFAPTGG